MSYLNHYTYYYPDYIENVFRDFLAIIDLEILILYSQSRHFLLLIFTSLSLRIQHSYRHEYHLSRHRFIFVRNKRTTMFVISMTYVSVFDHRDNTDDDETENRLFFEIVEFNISIVLTYVISFLITRLSLIVKEMI